MRQSKVARSFEAQRKTAVEGENEAAATEREAVETQRRGPRDHVPRDSLQTNLAPPNNTRFNVRCIAYLLTYT